MGVSGVFRSIIHITCVEHAHFKRHDPGREARIDEPLEVRVADLERQRVGELARLLPAQADDVSVDGGHKDLPVGQGQAVEDRLGIDRYAGQIPAVVSAESHHHGRSAGVERRFVRACIFGCHDGASGEDRIPSQGHASNQQRNFSRPEIGHLGWLLLLGEGHVVVLQLAVEFFHPFVGAEQMISVERSAFHILSPKAENSGIIGHEDAAAGADTRHDGPAAGPPPVPLAPREYHNLAEDAKYAQIVSSLQQLLRQGPGSVK